MAINEKKAMLPEKATAEVEKVVGAGIERLMDPEKPCANVVGVGVGVKWSNGEPTGDPALLALVTHKLDKSELETSDLVPPKIKEMQTDVLAIGYPVAGVDEPMGAGVQTLATRIRPAEGAMATLVASSE